MFGGADQGVKPAGLGGETVGRAGHVGNEDEEAAGFGALTAEEEGDILSRISILLILKSSMRLRRAGLQGVKHLQRRHP